MMCGVSVNKQVHVRRQTSSTSAVPENHVLRRICWVNHSVQCIAFTLLATDISLPWCFTGAHSLYNWVQLGNLTQAKLGPLQLEG